MLTAGQIRAIEEIVGDKLPPERDEDEIDRAVVKEQIYLGGKLI
jgi:hypothetical protein